MSAPPAFGPMRRRLVLAPTASAALSALWAGGVSSQDSADALEFALIGDTPYNQSEALQVERIFEEISRGKASFCMHLGDFKSGIEVCSDKMLSQRLALLDKFSRPLVLVPGDNEWLDCHRPNAGSFDPHERLERLRQLAFAKDETLGQTRMQVQSQRAQGFPENVRWTAQSQGFPVVFSSFNVPGSRDGWAGGSNAEQIQRRFKANANWLSEAVRHARQLGAPVLVLAAHADLGFDRWSRARWGDRVSAYAAWLSALANAARSFSGQLLYLHGDSHLFRHDKPLEDEFGPVANFTRVECYGSPFSTMWTRVRILAGLVQRGQDPFQTQSYRLYATEQLN